MAKFPKVRIGGDVRAQHKLMVEHFGIERLALVVGGSMGGQQVDEWAVRYPDMVARAAPIATTSRISRDQVMFVDACADALMSDPAWNRPDRIVNDGSQTNREAIVACDTKNRLQDKSWRAPKRIRIRQSKYLNNRIEQV